MFEVEINNIKIKTKIGVSINERKKEQLLNISIKFNYNLSSKKDLNNIKFLKDYSVIIKYLKTYIKKTRYKTLEKLITESKKNLKKEFNLKNLYIRVEKPIVAKKYGCKSISVSK